MSETDFDKSRLLGKEIPENCKIQNAFEIEDLLVALNKLDKNIEFLKGLKKNRAEQIDAEINEYNLKVEWLRNMILMGMKEHAANEKTLNFPGVAKVTRRNVKGTWSIEDEKALITFLTEQGMKDEVVAVKETVDKKKAKEVLEQLAKMRIPIAGAVRSDDSEGISVSFTQCECMTEKVQKLEQSQNIDELDVLEL